MNAPAIAYAICGVGDIPNRRARGFSLLRLDDGDSSGTPYHVVVLRWDRKVYGYVNRCPHQGSNLDWERNQFFDADERRLVCGKHGALFEVETGACIDGPCRGERLEPVPLAVLDGDICIVGVTLAAEADDPDDEPV